MTSLPALDLLGLAEDALEHGSARWPTPAMWQVLQRRFSNSLAPATSGGSPVLPDSQRWYSSGSRT
jgi:hypothetical protein